MASLTIEKRDGPRGRKYRPVIEWPAPGGRPGRAKGSWTRYWRAASIVGKKMLEDAELYRLGIKKAAPAPARTWGQLAAEYERYSRATMRPKTWNGWHRPTINAFTAFLKEEAAGAETPLSLIATATAKDFCFWLTDLGRAQNTVSAYGRHLSAIFNYGIRSLKWISENPCTEAPWPTAESTGTPIADPAIVAIVEHARSRLRPLVWIGRHTGMRVGEIVNLDKVQLDRVRSSASVVAHRRLKVRGSWQPKTRQSTRQVPILPDLWPLLGTPGTEGPVFPEYAALKPNERTSAVGKDFRIARELACAAALKRGDAQLAAQLEGVTFHDLKHSFCTEMLARGETTAKLSEITGTSEATLKRTYAHLVGRVTAKDLERISLGALPKFPPKYEPAAPERAGNGRFLRR